LAAALIGVLALGGCARREAPAPVDIRVGQRGPEVPATNPVTGSFGAPQPAAAPAAMPVGSTVDTVYVVQRGDTAYAVARRFDVPVKAIVDANNLQPPFGVQAGQRLTIPKPRAHLVEPGDTIQSVARRYRVDVSVLVRANDLQPPYALQPGQRLALPASIAGATQEASLPPPAGVAPLPAPAAAAPPPTGRPVEVQTLAPASPPPVAPPAAPLASSPPPPVRRR